MNRWTPALTALCFLLGTFAAANAQVRAKTTMKDSVEKTAFGKLDDGIVVDQYTLKNSSGAAAKIITYGATLTQLWMPDRTGKTGDIVLGFDNFQGYIRNDPWFGAIVGRVANRIAKGKFTLDGKTYSLEINVPPNSLHSGQKDLSRVVWKAKEVPALTEPRCVSRI